MHRHCLLLLLAVLVLLAEPLPVAAQEARVVRVGVFPLPGFNHIGEGTVSGYNMDYLEQVALSAGWILTPVVLDNWTDALRALDQGRIDLLGPALHTPDREKRYLFCRYPSGTAFTALVTLRDKTALTYEDFAAFENLRIGTAQSPFWQQNFAAYARRKAFTPPPLLIFNDMADARIAMRAGKVDAILGNAFNLLDDEKLLAKYDPAPFYYITTRQNQGLMAELNQAVAQLKLERPNLENRLARTYLARSYQTPLNREELDCIATMPPLRVGYNPDRKPLSWRDPATGEARGILPDIVRLAGRRSGLRFTFVPLTDKKKELEEYFAADAMDLAAGLMYQNPLGQLTTQRLSAPLLRSSLHLYVRRGKALTPDKKFTLALLEGWRGGGRYVRAAFPKAEIRQYPTAEDCLDAVVYGKADALLYTSLEVTCLLTKPRYKDITFLTEYQDHEDDRLALSPAMPPLLLSILNKTLADLDEREKSQIISDNVSSIVAPLSLADMLYEHRAALLLTVELVLFLTAFAAYAMYLRRRSRRAAQESERRLTTLAANINGGVLSLLADPPLHIAQANMGFWRLLGYDARPKEDALTAWLHAEDADKLRAAMHNKAATLSLELRLHHSDQTWLPVLLRGTPAHEDDGPFPVFHCVVVDITEQKNMQEELEQEKERYRILVEQSQDIIFDVDTEKRQFQCSPNFFAKFGREATPLFNGGGRPRNGQVVHPEDRPALLELRRRVYAGEHTVFSVVRIPTAEGRYIWCRIQVTRISKEGAPLRMIGKIVDIDEEVRRRAELERRSQRDSLTDLYNKTAFREQVRACMPARPEGDRTDALMFLDLDNFKELNDTLGHVVGDMALVDTAEALRRTFRTVDVMGRFGGDEFCIFLQGITREVLQARAEAVLAALRLSYTREGQKVDITASIGVYLFTGDESSYEEALQRADAALYYAKEAGKNRYTFFDDVADFENLTSGFHAFFPDTPAESAPTPAQEAPAAAPPLQKTAPRRRAPVEPAAAPSDAAPAAAPGPDDAKAPAAPEEPAARPTPPAEQEP
ncbi:transporter substrate-binding domain-containing diguanylate cyclase [Desulfovibrio legallii]|uniref:PAS domain S-box-containing protein/diguanylate cyclase (GGDEF) domain-containing protein n=1 Tax=Desulfovibrio legallii TaxID=571438 RepID=A0A1G7LVM8_9BACT|nr:diguanylate cyclase [Desulfovibrio legallii]SDF53545.1 PAS domain S-box-containing protein/diguanylate cyclase (GGDEF) domain-containing protein [Desulfovibrio legallii]